MVDERKGVSNTEKYKPYFRFSSLTLTNLDLCSKQYLDVSPQKQQHELNIKITEILSSI